jgi:hypothetical protein
MRSSFKNEISQIDNNLDKIIQSVSGYSRKIRNMNERNEQLLRNNIQLTIPSEISYDRSVLAYDDFQNSSNELFDSITILEEKLDRLKKEIVNSQELAREFRVNQNNARISDLQSLSRKVVDEQMDTSKMTPEEKQKLNEHLKEISEILVNNTPKENLKDFESIELAVREHMLLTA